LWIKGEMMKQFNYKLYNNKEDIEELLREVNLNNTVNGGTASTSINIIGSDEKLIIKVNAPGVKADAYNIILNFNKITISTWIKEGYEYKSFAYRTILVPLFVKTFDIPALVDLEKIEAIYEGGTLDVILPFKGNIDELQRVIPVFEK
jgi:HSP20 family protein